MNIFIPCINCEKCEECIERETKKYILNNKNKIKKEKENFKKEIGRQLNEEIGRRQAEDTNEISNNCPENYTKFNIIFIILFILMVLSLFYFL
jgi:hypothetical protein